MESQELIIELSEKYLQTTLVIDALDECHLDTRRELFNAINTITESSKGRIKVFLTSRYDDDINDMFCSEYNDSSLNHYLEAKDNSGDINKYIETQIEMRCDPNRRRDVNRLLLKGRVDADLKRMVIGALQEKADGM